MLKKLNEFFSSIVSFFGWRETDEIFEKIQIALTFLIQIAIVVACVIAFLERNWVVAFVSLLAMIAIWFPVIFIRRMRIYIPIGFELLLTLFVYASIFLGEFRGFYTKFWWWDVVLHMGSAIAFGFIGFLIIYSLYRHGQLKLNPSLLAVFSFTFALSLGALWEIFEFSMDSFFGMNMQKSGLVDTMWDLIIDTTGALIVAISGYFYTKFHKKGMGVFEHYLKSYIDKNL